jgi:uncharacterized protein
MADATDAATLDRWRERLEAAAAAKPEGDDGSHDLGHARRVWSLSQDIADAMDTPADRLVLLAASYLHDIVSLEKNDPRRAAASRMAADGARRILTALDFPPDKLDAVAHAIEAHSFSANIAPRTVEAKILQDADRMETLGAIGLARVFYVGGRIGTQLFDADDPLARNRPLDDLRFSLDHFQSKILRLPERMNTAPGRAIALERIKIMEHFLESLLGEIGAGGIKAAGGTADA